MGKPVIATAHGGSLETVTPGKTGWLVTPGVAQDLARAMEEALSSPETMIRYGIAGKEAVNSKFTMKTMCDRTMVLYRKLISDNRPHAKHLETSSSLKPS